MQHSQGVTSLAGYDYTYDAASRITAINSVLDGLTDYTNDATGQLTDADHNGQADEAYSYDENGNRVTSTVGTNNQILSDGTFDYEYDDEGNMVAKETIATGERVEYVWDHRNRLISIVSKDALGVVTQQVDQAYDVFQRWVQRSVDSDGAGPASATDTFFTYEGNQIALEFDGNTASDLSHRYLWGDMVDQILADEQVSSLASAGDVIWPLTDHLNTTRDLATYDAGTDVTTNANHRRFDSFGNIISQTNGSVTILVGFTARPLDAATGLQWNLNRWYVSTLGTWMSEDPIGFNAGDGNNRRYVGNSSTTFVDPNGLALEFASEVESHPASVRNLGANIYGETSFNWRVTSSCECVTEPYLKGDKEFYVPHLNVKITSAIRIDQARIIEARKYQLKRKEQGLWEGQIVSVEGVYGHEQRHVQSFQKLASDMFSRILDRLANSYRTIKECKTATALIEKEIDRQLRAIEEGERKHTNPTSPDAYLDYDPIGKMPTLTQG